MNWNHGFKEALKRKDQSSHTTISLSGQLEVDCICPWLSRLTLVSSVGTLTPTRGQQRLTRGHLASQAFFRPTVWKKAKATRANKAHIVKMVKEIHSKYCKNLRKSIMMLHCLEKCYDIIITYVAEGLIYYSWQPPSTTWF